jgi:rhamnogalacturonyl hydrolase YesR/beta-glucanase (GH16 family)
MNKKIYAVMVLATIAQLILTSCSSSTKAPGKQNYTFVSKTEALEVLNRVNRYWQTNHPEHGNAFWHRAAYHTGNMAAYEVTGNKEYLAYSYAWAEHNEWKGAKSDDRENWKYSYGESDDHVLFGDWQICFQVYADLYRLEPKDHKIARTLEVMAYQMSTPRNDYWWWADALYMVMPVMTKLYHITGNNLYLEKLYDYFAYARDLMYDEEAALFYRDAKYIYPAHKTKNGKKDFWARGNGWVFAGLAKVLDELPARDPHRDEYLRIYRAMASSLMESQQAEGYWSRSLLDLSHAPGYETSGTAFFLYGYLWGINNGLLSEKEYLPVVKKGWEYLTNIALQENGLVGYVQPIGERADQHRNVGPETTADFGVGAFLLAASEMVKYASAKNSFTPGAIWRDDRGKHINAHGGGILYHDGRYYWFGEHKGEKSNAAHVGVTCYSSDDLYNWKYEGVALTVSDDPESPIVRGSTIERPKVIYNAKTGKFVMYFHLELRGRGYEAAQVAVAVSDRVTGPYQLIKNGRVNAGVWPMNMTEEQRNSGVKPYDFGQWWTPEWMEAVKNGLFVRRDFEGGQMSRDMTLFVDDDKKAYHIYASEENLTLHIAELSDDYLSHTGRYIRVAPGGHNEAPTIFKKDGRYYMITSGCTGWEPNAARLLVADEIMGEWKVMPNPARGEGANRTFESQGTFILPVTGKQNAFIFMADRWRPNNPIDGRYIWLPVLFENDLPLLKWFDEWDLTIFDEITPDSSAPEEIEGYSLVWHDEFNQDGTPDPAVWSFEEGFVRNHELQWYQQENALCRDGRLIITGRREKKNNPLFEAGSNDWRHNREQIEYSSSSIKTVGKKEFQYGHFEIRAKIPTASGSWPAIWTLGTEMEWPSNGEIDIMEFYRIDGVPHILANVAWGTEERWNAKWNTSAIPFTHFTNRDPHWADKFHIWKMDWDEEAIRLYLDDELLNETPLSGTINGSLGKFKNPFKQPHYLLLNLAIGGQHGGTPDDTAFPLRYEIDYVRVYQHK